YSTVFCFDPSLLPCFSFLFFFFIALPPPRSTLFPYTTLFRSLPDCALLPRRGPARQPRRRVHPARPRNVVRRAGRRAGGVRGAEIGRAQRLNSSHVSISYAVFCLKKKKKTKNINKNTKTNQTQ